ncbi:MAG: protocatechuate 3,4-dioxygenase [Myxococcota bacterium]
MKVTKILGFTVFAVSLQAVQIPDHLWHHSHSMGRGAGRARPLDHAPTPAQILGPFFPVRFPEETDPDLTHVDRVEAKGVKIYVNGRVFDTQSQPVVGAVVEIWQACQAGSYNHPADSNPAPRDPNFQYYASTITDADGGYLFKTIVPGPYPAEGDWVRPSHIHFKVTHRGHHVLVTQLYFNGKTFGIQELAQFNGKPVTGLDLDKLNEADHLLRELSQEDRDQLIVKFLPHPRFDSPAGLFDLYLEKTAESDL